MPLSIRWRLTLWNTSALAVVLLGFGGLVYGLMRHALYERVDRSLLTAWQELEQKPNQDLVYWIKEAKEHQNLSCIVYDAAGAVIERTEEMPATSIPAAPARWAGSPEFFDTALPVLGRQRILHRPLQAAGKELNIVLLAELEDVDRELHELLVVLGMAVPASLATAAGLGYWLARKALVPMQELRRLTEEITADRLDRRLPITHAGDELGSLAQTINAMIGRLECSFAEIRRFTADASHELRTPLTAIRTETEVALRQPLNPGECRQLFGSILEECDRLARLTDQLLALSREDAGALRQASEPLDLAALVASVAETMRPMAEAKGLDLRNGEDSGVRINGDGARLRQVFFNLLDNAIKYTPPGGEIEVQVEPKHNAAVVTIRDTGIGIPPEHVAKVFDRFYRVDKARSREQGGTGLGLSIAKTIVNAHGGQIELASTPGGGTTCAVTLPLKSDAQE